MQMQVGVYKTLEKIGEGGMGEVYRGLDTMLEREVAIKQLRAEFSGRSDIVERFRTEAVTLGKLSHPNVVTLYSFLREDNALYMVLEFVRGETLDALIRRRGALPWTEAVGFVIQALRGLEHAHQMQVIHRDLKPANVILTSAGVLKLMDFGIARILNTARMTRVGHMVGTLQYMAPEQVKGAEGDARSDLYSLGIVLYELLAGRVPFDGATDYELIKAQVEAAVPPLETLGVIVPAALVKVLERALEKAPQKRFQSAGEFAQELQTVLDRMGAMARVNRQPDGVGVAVGESIRTAGSVFGSGLTRVRGAFHWLTLRAHMLRRATLAFVKANPIVAAAVIMVLIGLGLALAARSDKDAPVSSNAGPASKGAGADMAAPNRPGVTGGATAPAMTTDGPRFKMPTGPLLTPGGEGPPPAPVGRPVVRPPGDKPAPSIAKTPVALPPSDPTTPQATETPPAPSSLDPTPRVTEKPAAPSSPDRTPRVTEKPAAPSSPDPTPRRADGEGLWKDAPVRR